MFLLACWDVFEVLKQLFLNVDDMAQKFRLLLLVSFIFLAELICCQTHLSFEVMPGLALALPTSLVVMQDGKPDISVKAHYAVKSFEVPIYYSYRLGVWMKHHAWEIELNHLKIYLQNRPPEIDRFSISHGYNQIWINRIYYKSSFLFRIGIGPVITHNESTIRGLRWDEKGGFFNDGYYLSGITSQVALQKRYFLSKGVYFSAEGKVSAAYAKVKVVNGNAHVPVIALHFLVGVGVQL